MPPPNKRQKHARICGFMGTLARKKKEIEQQEALMKLHNLPLTLVLHGSNSEQYKLFTDTLKTSTRSLKRSRRSTKTDLKQLLLKMSSF